MANGKFYFFESEIYRTKREVVLATKNHTNKNFEEIETSNTWSTFADLYYKAREEGDSCGDSLIWAASPAA